MANYVEADYEVATLLALIGAVANGVLGNRPFYSYGWKRG